MLKTAVIGKTINGATQVTRIIAISGDKIILVDATTGQAPKKVTTKIVDKDLHIFAEGASDPSVIVSDYALYDQTVQITGLGSGGEYVNYGVTAANTMELGAISAVPATSSAPFMSTSAWWGVGILAVVGGAAAAAGGGGGGGSSSEGTTSTTKSAILVDGVLIGVDYYINNVKVGTTGADGSFAYKTGDTVTFKVGAATLGAFTPTSTTVTVTISDLAGGNPTKTANLAKFLQSLDSDLNSATITIDPTTAATITQAADVQTDPTAGNQITVTVTNPDLTALSDHTAPGATILLSDTVLNAGETATVTITFTEPVAGFDKSDVTAPNGSLSNFTTANGGQTWIATFVPSANTAAPSNAISLASTYTDAAGNAGIATKSENYSVVTTVAPPSPPSLIITDDENTVGNIAGGSITYTFTFSDTVTGFIADDIVVTGGTKGTFGGSDATYTLVVTPTDGYEGDVSVSVAAGAAIGIGSSLSLAANETQVVDMKAPSALTLDLSAVNDTGLSNTDNITSASTMSITGVETGTTWQYSLDSGSTWTNGSGSTFNLSSNTTYAIGTIQVRQIDAAGNISNSTSTTEAITIDSIGPKLTITDDEPMVTANMDGSNTDGTTDANGADILYTFKFDEAVKDFTVNDIVVTMQKTDGTVDYTYTAATDPSGLIFKTFTASPDGMTYTLSVTPKVGYEGNMAISVLPSAYHDVAGDVGNVVSDTTSVQAVDMLAPILNDTVYDGTSDWTYDIANRKIIFTLDSPLQAVSMTTPDNFVVELNTKPVAVQAVEMLGNTVTLIMSESFIATESVRVVYKDATGNMSAAIQDLAGNDATSFTYLKPDVTPPTVISILFANPSLIIGQSTQVTIMFSEEIKDIVVSYQNGTLTNLTPDANDASIWRATFTASDSIENTNNLLTVTSFHDLNDVANITTGVASYSIDTLAPSLSISDDESGIGNIAGGVINYTFTFSEPVQNFVVQDITVANGDKGLFTAISSTVYTLAVTPKSGFEGDVTVSVAAGKATDLAGNLNTAADQSIQTVDMLALDKPSFALKTDSGVDVLDGITNVSLIDVTVIGKAWEYSLDGGGTWNAGNGTTFNLANGTYNAGDIGLRQSDVAGNISAATYNTSIIVVDKTAPHLLGSMDVSDYANGNIVITMTELLNSTDIAKENFAVWINGTAQTKLDKDGVAQPIFGASIFNDTIVITGLNFNNGDSIKVAYSDLSSTDSYPGLKDIAGNNAVGFTSIVSTLGSPTAVISMSDTNLKVGETSSVTITFSEAVKNFSNSDITVEGGTLSALATTDNIVWTAIFTPTAGYENNGNAISISGNYTDLSGNSGSSATILDNIDTLSPTITITDSESASISNLTGGAITYTFSFSEAVTGFTASDINVSGGAKGTFTAVSTSVYTLVVTPTAGYEGSLTVDVSASSASDSAGNGNGAATQSVQAVDKLAPTLVITDDEAATTANIAGGSITYTFTFSENVVGFTADDIAVANGIKGAFAGSGSSYTLVVSPIAGSTAPITIDVLGVNQVDASGNTGVNKTASQAVDMSAPTATITMSDSALKIGDTSTVTIAFSESVIGFSNADVTVSNGILGTFTTANGGVTWTATFTPTVNIENTANVITLANSYTDVNLNTGTAETSDNYTIDTIAPTVTITNDQVGIANIIGGDILYTFTFSEAVTGFTVADVAVVGGTKAAAVVQTSATTYTLLVTPTGTGNVTVNIADGTTTGIADTAGNLSIAAFQSTQAVDMVVPTVVSVILADTALTIGETSAVTITFSEAVTNFDNTDVSLAGAKGTLGELTSADNKTWTGLFTPTAITSDASNVIQVLNTYTDVAGNYGTLGVSGNFTIDTRPSPVAAPTFHLTTDDGLSTSDGITHTNGVTVASTTGNWEYSLDGGSTWATGIATTFSLVENISYAVGQIQVRQTDTNGNVSTIATNTQTTIVDTVVAIPIISAVATNDVIDASENANLVISGTGEVGATVTLAVTNQTAIVDASGAWNIVVLDPATSFAQGSETLSVTQTDVAGNTSLAGTRDIFIDTVKPTLDPLVNVKANIGSDSIILTFTESLAPVDFSSAGSFIVEINGTVYNAISPITSSDLISAVATTDKTVTLVLDTGIHNITLGDTIRVGYIGATGGSPTAIQDLVGNDAPSFGYVTATVENTDTPPVLTNMIANGANITLTFNEALNASIANLPAASDFTVKVNGVTDTVSGVSITGSNVALTLATAYANNDLVEVTYKDNVSTTNAIQDLIGNDALSFTYTSTADTVSPTATITMSDTALTVGETSTVTIAFSEAVTGFSLTDLTAPNGTLSVLNTVDNITWTATFTPITNVNTLLPLTPQMIDLGTNYSDIVGNIGTVALSGSYTIDTQAPALYLPATLLLAPNINAAAHQLTFNFDKALDPVNFAPTSMFYATDGVTYVVGDPTQLVHFTISNVAIHNDPTVAAGSQYQAIVTIDPSIAPNTTNPSPITWTLVYNDTPANDVLALQDIYGNDVSSFTRTAVI